MHNLVSLTFSFIVYIFAQDIVLQEYYSPQGETRQGEGPQALVPASKRFHRTGQDCACEDTQSSCTASQSRFTFSHITRAMDMNFSGDSNQDYYPWKCACGRINKKWHTECAVCFAPWTQGTRHPTQPKNKKQELYGWNTYGWDDWGKWEEDKSRSSSRASSRHHFGATDQAYATYPSSSQMPMKAKGNSKGKKGKQGKSQSKQNEQMSPFQAEPKSFAPWATLDTSAFTPSTTLSPNPFAAASSSLVAQDQEWVEALKRAYPDPALMPEETKLLVEKAEKTHGRKGIKNLHQATTYLGKVKDHLSEVSDHRRPTEPYG